MHYCSIKKESLQQQLMHHMILKLPLNTAPSSKKMTFPIDLAINRTVGDQAKNVSHSVEAI